MTFLLSPQRAAARWPLTIQSCSSCGEAMREERSPANHDRAALVFLRCRCGRQDGHRIERRVALEVA